MATNESSSEPQPKKSKINEEEEDDDNIFVDDPSSSDGESGSDNDSPYNSDSAYYNSEHREEFHRYRQQVIASEGFDVDPPECPVLGGIIPFDVDGAPSRLPYKALRLCAEFAVKEHQLQLVEVFKANRALAADGLMYYITSSAKSFSPTTDEEQPKIYQAKVRYRFIDDGIVLEFFRLKTDENSSRPAS